MEGLFFEWDAKKAAANFRKHGATFEEASSVFGDALSVTIPDPTESEERCALMGMSNRRKLPVVVHTDS
ncbi:MAG: BrnT family toxin [Bryobacteraceae bacterium]|nr:BrnT family toxin [Bryobacteraceae bacterium]